MDKKSYKVSQTIDGKRIEEVIIITNQIDILSHAS